jgi:hypothetical protein
VSTHVFATFFEIVVQEHSQILRVFGVQIEEMSEIVLNCPLEFFVVVERLLQEGVELVFELQEVLND